MTTVGHAETQHRSSGDRVQIVAGNHSVTRLVFGDIPPEHAMDVRFEDLTDPALIGTATAGASAIVVDDEALTAEHIQAFSESVRVIGKLGTGLDTVDVEAARARGVEVVYLPGSAVDEVADHTVALILAATRNLVVADATAREDWDQWQRVGRVRVLRDTTVGMVGLGRIGRAVVDRLRPFGCRILVSDPMVTEAPEGVELVSGLEELLPLVDVVNLQVPLLPSTQGLIGHRELSLMRPDALIVNTTRGGVIDQEALTQALVEHRIGGAALDVLVDEPPRSDEPILTAPGVTLSPHIAWYSVSAEARMRDNTLRAVANVLDGVPLTAGAYAP